MIVALAWVEKHGTHCIERHYSEEDLQALAGGRSGLPLIEVLALDIPAEHRVWAASLPGILPGEIALAWMKIVADRAVRTHVGGLTIDSIARGWLDGADRTGGTMCAGRWIAYAASEALYAAQCSVEAPDPAGEGIVCARTPANVMYAAARAVRAAASASALLASVEFTPVGKAACEAEYVEQVVDLQGLLS